MARASAKELYEWFRRYSRGLEQERRNAEGNSTELRSTVVERIYEATFLTTITGLESLLEELFFSCLTATSDQVDVTPIVGVSSRAAAIRFTTNAERRPSYLDWLPFQRTLKRADSYLQGGRPFSRLRDRAGDLEVLSQAQAIRNAIAHRGPALKKFRQALPVSTLPSAKRRPGPFLRSTVFHGGEPRTQHEAFSAELRRLSRALCASSAQSARHLLRPYREYRSGDRPGGGSYECKDCSATFRHYGQGPLAACPSCGTEVCPECGATSRSRFKRL